MAAAPDQPMANGTTHPPDTEAQTHAAHTQDAPPRSVLARTISELVQQQPIRGYKTIEVEVDSSRVKMTVATKEEEEKKEKKEFLDKKRGWMMTVLALLASMAMQAAFHPPDWLPKGLDDHGHSAAGADIYTPSRTFWYFLSTGAAFVYTTAAIPVMLSSSRLAVGYELVLLKIVAVVSVLSVGVVFAIGSTSERNTAITCGAAQVGIAMLLYFLCHIPHIWGAIQSRGWIPNIFPRGAVSDDSVAR